MRTLFLHVGPHKTGTTTIQSTCVNQRYMLEKHDISYFPGNNHTIFYKAFSDCIDSFHQFYRGWKRTVNQDFEKETIRKELSTIPCSNIIVSSEDISLLSENSLSELREFLIDKCDIDNVICVAFIRNPFGYLKSSIQQFIKPGLTDLDDIVSNKFKKYYLQGEPSFSGGINEIITQLYLPIPTRLIKVFGQENVHFASFEEAINNGLTQTLLNFISDNDFYLSDDKSNEGISHEACLFLAELNNRFPLLNKENVLNKNRNRNKDIVYELRKIPGRKSNLILSRHLNQDLINRKIQEFNSFSENELFHIITEEDMSSLYGEDYFSLSKITTFYLKEKFGIVNFEDKRKIINDIVKGKFKIKYFSYKLKNII